ncbi:MAG: hypothetical protein COY82_01970 [Parcubacteria group bacterium CG_4_10_14_0_8_um_filter_35_7]|nr:MAG: hypothetical protein COX43_03980 [Parcubacteria group bacterium CG23_combo_of_CG06-09_8_20_14_all_35_9]PIY78536.1 MAG: hypothetical protein COY82_01970 [Parcubacteria group bacterium CG_4_10_14_0_8_um_filter_35_7]
MLKKKYDVITIGGATRDFIFYTDQGVIVPDTAHKNGSKLVGFKYASKIYIKEKEAYLALGGGGCNTAITFSKLGLKVATLVRVGNDKDGQAIIEKLKKEKVGVKFTQFDRKVRTAFSILIMSGGEYVAFCYRGANNELRITNYELGKMNTKWFYISSLSGENWESILERIKRASQKNKIKLAWNPGSRQLRGGRRQMSKFLSNTEVLILNKDEARILVLSDKKYSKEKVRLNDVRFLLKVLKGWGPNIIVITQGSKGASIYEGRKFYHLPAFKVKMLNATGAGDAFGASFIAGLILYNYDIEKSLKLAIVNSAYVTTKVGAQNGLLTRKEAEKKMGCK